ncbi:MAG: DUF2804 family protein [Chitinophagales bacterium]|nr:DUF2804 family protein [Bacteroidota bacterium]
MILPKQEHLIENEKVIPFGIYDDLIRDVSTSFFDKQGFLTKKRRTERKTWIFVGVFSPELICGFAIVDAGMVATAFSYFYSFKDSIFEEDKTTVPLGFDSNFNPNLDSEWTLGNYSIKTNSGKTHLQYLGKYKLYIDIENNEKGVSIVAPSKGERPFNFTYKNMCVPAKVQINNGGINTYACSGNYAAIDFTKGFPPRETIWNWLSFIGKTESNKTIAVNLVDRFNDNMENILWLNGEKMELSNAHFSMKQPYNSSVWEIKTADGILDCQLTPKGARSENINAVLMKSKFIQPFGRLEGTVLIDGIQEKFTAIGVAEDHHAVW